MMIDCTDMLADTGASPLDFATLIRKEIKEKTGCNASAGMGMDNTIPLWWGILSSFLLMVLWYVYITTVPHVIP